MRVFFDRFGYDALGYLQNTNIVDMINMSEEDYGQLSANCKSASLADFSCKRHMQDFIAVFLE